MEKELISWDDFSKIDMRVGTIISAEIFKEARKPAYKIMVDFGKFGQRKSSAQITKLYNLDDLVGRQVICVVNFPKKQIATLQSECLIMGVVDGDVVTLLSPERKVENGFKIG